MEEVNLDAKLAGSVEIYGFSCDLKEGGGGRKGRMKKVRRNEWQQLLESASPCSQRL